MPVCSYLVVPRSGQTDAAARSLAALPGCEVTPAADRELLILVTDTSGKEAEEALRDRLAAVDEVMALLLTFGEVEPAGTPLPVLS